MDAIVIREFGPARNLQLERVPDPVPAPGSVRIAVAASGVHVIDTRIRAGMQLGPFPLPDLPYVPGREVVGTVDAAGSPAEEHLLGARVAVSLGNANGGYAALAVAPAADLHVLDDALDAATAITMVGTGRTALGLLEGAALTPGETVLITAAAGGVGSVLVQAARRAGARVIALAGGPAKVALARDNGADLAVDYLDPDWPAHVRDAGFAPTVLFDAVCGAVTETAIDLLATPGRVVAYGNTAGNPAAPARAVPGVTRGPGVGPTGGFTPDNIHRWAAEALTRAAHGELNAVTTKFSLADAATAHARLENRSTVGKVVLEVV